MNVDHVLPSRRQDPCLFGLRLPLKNWIEQDQAKDCDLSLISFHLPAFPKTKIVSEASLQPKLLQCSSRALQVIDFLESVLAAKQACRCFNHLCCKFNWVSLQNGFCKLAMLRRPAMRRLGRLYSAATITSEHCSEDVCGEVMSFIDAHPSRSLVLEDMPVNRSLSGPMTAAASSSVKDGRVWSLLFLALADLDFGTASQPARGRIHFLRHGNCWACKHI